MKGIVVNSFIISGEDGSCIKGYRDNMGEPFRSGVSLRICRSADDNGAGVFVQDHEIEQLISALRSIRKQRQ
ncbi:hypothetical protein [Bradyrhizobium ottawaense]|uniref:Uncharacterized protein n=1 Tax=Bradyrhizobium ottawaense TaxID=931866 RepID=A0ABY0P534_9BRAD|nr:hypothetical protein [Bradyrhizobium ottawaense]SDH37369.1 hypothetical protein SAMN05444163_0002 [Bradyrhizobium ottawaense]SDK45793.1 hypothetical protein SAMN05444163_8160 [Bradyrhizobium ottawaense]